MVGAGAIAGTRLRYMGTDEMQLLVFPYVDIRWRDRAFLDPVHGLGVNLIARGRVRAGIAGHVDPGREVGDGDRLRGMGDVRPAAEVRLFGAYEAPRVSVLATARRRLGEGGGLLVDLSAARGFALSRRLLARVGPSLGWTNGAYARTYFGVTQAQAGRSGLPSYVPAAGVRDVGVVAMLAYQLDSRWVLLGHARATRLTGDAPRSPVVARRENGQIGTFLVHRF
ncbi:MAG TPA: MipA/OmpV family protein [Gemmatimonadaceae bacterium]